jgi:hypothetical protein
VFSDERALFKMLADGCCGHNPSTAPLNASHIRDINFEKEANQFFSHLRGRSRSSLITCSRNNKVRGRNITRQNGVHDEPAPIPPSGLPRRRGTPVSALVSHGPSRIVLCWTIISDAGNHGDRCTDRCCGCRSRGSKFSDPLFYAPKHKKFWREIVHAALDAAAKAPVPKPAKATPDEVATFSSHCVYIRSVYLLMMRIWRDSNETERKTMEAVAPVFFEDVGQVLSEFLVNCACRVTERAADSH